MKNAGKACNNRLYRHIRTFEKIIKNYFVIYSLNGILFLTESSKSPAEIAKSNKSGCGLAIIQSGGKGYGEKSF